MDIGHERLVKLVDRLLAGEIVLPDIQREFVWTGSKIPRLLDSLYREWPVGSVLLWDTTLDVPIKTAAIAQGAPVGVRPTILLDGQQRLTTLARVLSPKAVPHGQKPPDIRFHPQRQEFRTANAVQAKDPNWLSVSSILAEGAQYRDLLRQLGLDPTVEDEWYDVISDMAKKIRDYHLPVQTISIDDYETVAEIFNRVNTGGRPLTKGDLVMGVLAARWPGTVAKPGSTGAPGGRQHIESFEEDLRKAGWPMNREVLLRIMSVISLNSPNHTRLLGLKKREDWELAWDRTVEAVNHARDFLKNDAKIAARSLLPTEYVLLIPAVYLERTKGAFPSGDSRDALARWVLLASAFGHYSGSLETTLASDVSTLSLATDEIFPRLVRDAFGARTPEIALTADEIRGKTAKSPFLRLLQIAAVAGGAKSWWGHRALTYDPHGSGMSVEIHHIFPRNWLRKNGMADHPDLDTLANFAFLSKHDNIKISDGSPRVYLEAADPAELQAQWIPMDRDLWSAEGFEAFCAERSRLLAQALNSLLGLGQEAHDTEPLDADETPMPQLGAWAEELGEEVA